MERPRIAIAVERRRTSVGEVQLDAIADHYVSVHAGAPVRVSCQTSRVREVRARGDIDIVPAGMSGRCVEDDPCDAIALRLPPSLLALAAEELGIDGARAGVVPRSGVRDAQIEHIAWALDADARAETSSGLVYRESLSLALAVHLVARYRSPLRTPGGLPPRQLERVVDYIEAHLRDDLSLVRLARVAGVSASHFTVLFKRSMGVPVHAYIVQRRVVRARELLVRGELTPSAVALEVGFAHQSHMARWMRRVLGVTPAAIVRSRR